MSLPRDQKCLSQLGAGRCVKPSPRAPQGHSTSVCKVLPLGKVKFPPEWSRRSRGKPRSIQRMRPGRRHPWFVLGGDHPCDSPARCSGPGKKVNKMSFASPVPPWDDPATASAVQPHLQGQAEAVAGGTPGNQAVQGAGLLASPILAGHWRQLFSHCRLPG